jgi:hypothetical protein
MLRRASTAAIAKASFFIAVVPAVMTYPEDEGDYFVASAEKTHSQL